MDGELPNTQNNPDATDVETLEAVVQTGIEPAQGSPSQVESYIEETVRAAREYAEAARAPNTLTSLRLRHRGLRRPTAGLSSEAPEALPAYSGDRHPLYYRHGERGARGKGPEGLHDRAPTRLHLRLAQEGGVSVSPTEDRLVRETMKGIRRKKGSRSENRLPRSRSGY